MTRQTFQCVFLLLAVVVGNASAASPPVDVKRCGHRHSDGPWYDVGVPVPKKAVVVRKLQEQGADGLRQLLGAPFTESGDNAVWVYETRREYTEEWCDPPDFKLEYDQIFTIITLLKEDGKATCLVEAKEFLGPTLISRDAALQLPRTPLGYPQQECGAP